ncbi:MAG: nicotinate-nucleotide adenylyltransferase [Planctomycetota bacterium]|nr:nicotinate-nucleotide adenylyltransferase [Planctomycetota bacterium]
MKLGLYGGTFDPVHFGHLLLAERCREELELDEVRFIPAGDPPHKDRDDLSSGIARAEMLEFATAGNPRLVVDRRELKRPGRSFTVETLTEVRHEFPVAELYFLMGADSLADLPQWREPERISQLARIVAVNRGDRPLPDVATLNLTLGEAIASRVTFVSMPGIDLSSTELRGRVAAGKGLRYTMPPAVEAYIRDRMLYQEVRSEK